MTGVSVDLSKLMAYKDKTVKGLTGGIEFLFKKNGVTYIKGKGALKVRMEGEVVPCSGCPSPSPALFARAQMMWRCLWLLAARRLSRRRMLSSRLALRCVSVIR